MKRINTSRPNKIDRLTVMVVGDSRSGKSRFAATFPRPFFLSEGSEHGWTTIQYMDDAEFYEHGRRPQAWEVETAVDVVTALKHLQEQAAGHKVTHSEWPFAPGRDQIATVVIDSLTFYADSYFSDCERRTAGRSSDKRQLYGLLHQHLAYLMIEFHKLPYNIVWTALPKEGAQPGQNGGAMVAGQMATKAPARCDLWLHMQRTDRKQGNDLVSNFTAYTQPFAGMGAGHRFGNALPNALDNPSYALIEEHLQISPWTARAAAAPAAPPPKKASQVSRRIVRAQSR